MNRRDTMLALAALGAAPGRALSQAQGKVWRVGYLGVTSASGYANELEAIRARFRELGYAEGRNLLIEFRWAEGDPGRLRTMAAELVALKVDAIIAHSIPGVRIAAAATKSIPIVIADAADPVEAGVVAHHARPGGNITGSTSFQPENAGKRLELLKEMVPNLKRVAALFNALNTNNAVYLRELQAAAGKLGLDLREFGVKRIEDLAGTFAEMARAGFEAVVIGEDPVLNTHTGAAAALALAHRLPASGFTNFAGAGGLIGYGANRPLVYARTANFIDRIFKGAKPGDLPIERATKFDLIVNAKTAKALGIKIPPQVLLRADRVIE